MRFQFDNDWKSDIFLNLVEKRSEKINPIQIIDEKFKCIELDSLSQETGELLTTYPAIEEKSIKNLFYENDILFGKLRPYLRKYYKTNFNGCCSSEIWVLYSKVLNHDFLYHYIQTNKFNMLANISTGSKMPRADWNIISESELFYSSKEEMIKIGQFFNLLEERIKLQSKIIEDYTALKKQIIESELTDNSFECTEYKLSSILKETKHYSIKDGSIPHATLSKEGIFEKNERYDRDFLVKSEDKAYKISNYNDICYNPANLKFGVITINKFGNCIFSPIYITFKVSNSFDPDYIALYLCRNRFINKARRYEQGTVYERTSVSPEDLLSIKVTIPPLNKQKECVRKIELLNTKILLEEEILSKLKAQKAYLLNNLFI